MDKALYDSFTERELEILRLVALGLSNRDIADELIITVGTVRWYTKQIYSKLGVHGRVPALVRAKELGLLEEHAVSKTETVGFGKKPSNHNLLAATTPFIGRAHEIAEIKRLLHTSRLLTLTGVGGTGKTRLALQAALEVLDEFAEGVYFVDLAPLSADVQVAQAISGVLGVVENPNESLLATLKRVLGGREMLLLLDNFEHVIQAAPLVSELLSASPSLKMLVTSREILRLSGEQEYPVPPLSLPPAETTSIQDVTASEAGTLFVQRAQMIVPQFAISTDNAPFVAQICTRLEGLPLSIELAATWLKSLPCEAIAKQIQLGLDFLATSLRDVPERHRSIRAVFEHSWMMLSAEEKTTFMKLTVFAGGCTAHAAQWITGASVFTLSALVDKSFVRKAESGRYAIHELLRQYGQEKLMALPSEYKQLQQRFVDYYAEFVGSLYGELQGPNQVMALNHFEADIDNIQMGWQWALHDLTQDHLYAYLQCLSLYFMMRGRRLEGDLAISPFQKLLKSVEPRLAAQGLMLLARLKVGRQQNASIRLARKAVRLWSKCGITLDAGFSLGVMAQWLPETELADELLHLCQEVESRAIVGHDHWNLAWIKFTLGTLASQQSYLPQSQQLFEQSADSFRHIKSRWGLTFPLGAIEKLMFDEGLLHQAKTLNQETLALCEETGDLEGVLWRYWRLGEIAVIQRDVIALRGVVCSALKLALPMSFTLWQHIVGTLAVRLLMLDQRWEQAVELAALLQNGLAIEDRNLAHPGWLSAELSTALTALESTLPASVFFARKQHGVLQRFEPYLAEFFHESCEATTSITQGTNQLSAVEVLVEPLSDRELEVLHLVSDGLSNREIAGHLAVTVGTVKVHTRNIYGKLNVNSRTQAVARARALLLFVILLIPVSGVPQIPL